MCSLNEVPWSHDLSVLAIAVHFELVATLHEPTVPDLRVTLSRALSKTVFDNTE